MIETGHEDIRGTETFAYSQIAEGKLTEAYQTAGAENVAPQLLALLATSEGAEPDWQEQALKIPAAELENAQHAIILAALAARLQRPHNAYLERYSELMQLRDEGRPKTVIDFVAEVIKQAPQASLESEMDGLGPTERGLVFAAAIIVHPKSAPPHWRKATRQLLFAIERPYFAVD